MFNRPSLSEIVTRTRADTFSRLSQDELLRFSDAEILARVLAGASHELHGYLDFIARQILPDSSEDEFLIRWASIFGLQRKDPQVASGLVSVSGIVGSVIADGALIKHADGREYAVEGEQVLTTSSQTVSVVAIAAGAAGNLVSGTRLAFLSPVVGVQSDAAVAASGIVNGSDIEEIDDLRARLLSRLRQPPNGGSRDDYVAWALEVPGVTRAWVYPGELGPGTVTVRFVRDNDASIIPDAGEVAAVQAYIDARKPVTAEVHVVAPLPLPVDYTIDITPDTLEVRAAVQAELAGLYDREAQPGGRLYLSHSREAISVAAGEADHVLASPTADIVPAVGEIPVLGVIAWV
ncbi:baseplate J/gp47 family protein [Noviherbaspirillum cavernae]|uniref:Baseplate J/gp47 family protein n=1 Tax=Noviherbaspirillum cavernae TaxID=2320862 RepID=A0A418X1B4_9BURK|nr:baseplate J/gp47 family protein [Noviherbaspirillum cavernae]RJG06242.1 baseplate J/gp47 family protein [Noviherbaspirillum cavernae]